jgi:hypothetical protein
MSERGWKLAHPPRILTWLPLAITLLVAQLSGRDWRAAAG